METMLDAADARFTAEASRFRESLGRSGPLVSLFDFLVDRATDDRIPKEIEIAHEVFGRSTNFETAQDASVRVYIHRLRRKLDEFYAGSTGPRLLIPRGEYRLSLSEGETPPSPDEDEPREAPPPRFYRKRLFWMIAALLLALNVAALLAIARSRPVNPDRALMDTVLWKPLAQSRRLTFVVLGDYYIFGEAPDEVQVKRLVREFSINSREDLDQYLMSHPEDAARFVDVDLHYVPTGTAKALSDLLPLVNATANMPGTRARVLTTSDLTPYILKGANIVYVGYLSGLGILRDPLFDVSGFSVGSSYDELIDRASGKKYSSDWAEVTDNRTPHHDYGYLASFPGPSGNRVLIVAGTRDAAVMQAAEVAADKTQLEQLGSKAGDRGAFEALYEVRTLGNLNLGARLILARPLRLNGAWRSNQPRQTFPDQLPPSDRLGSDRAPGP